MESALRTFYRHHYSVVERKKTTRSRRESGRPWMCESGVNSKHACLMRKMDEIKSRCCVYNKKLACIIVCSAIGPTHNCIAPRLCEGPFNKNPKINNKTTVASRHTSTPLHRRRSTILANECVCLLYHHHHQDIVKMGQPNKLFFCCTRNKISFIHQQCWRWQTIQNSTAIRFECCWCCCHWHIAHYRILTLMRPIHLPPP